MTKSLIALAFACVCGMLLVATPEVAQSQNVTISGCSNPSFNPNTFVLTCGGGGSGPPSCSISGNANGTTGANDVLTANCSPAATSYAWTGGSCASQTGQTCTANESSTGQVAYTVTGANASGTGSASSAFNVTWYSTTGAPQGCAITPATQSMGSAGGAINKLTVACAGGAPLTTFTWTASGTCNPSFVPSTTNQQNDNLPANTSTTQAATCTYKATVDNGSGSPQAPTATASVAAKTTAIDCKSSPQGAALGITGSTTTYNVPWVVDSGNADYTGNGTVPPEKPGMAYVGVIKVPAGAPTGNNTGRMDLHEYIDTPHYRLVTLSQTPCSWGTVGDGLTFTQFGLDPNFYFTVGGSLAGYASMQPGSTWYVNVVMQDPAKIPPKGNQCGSTTCNMVLEFWKPNGT